MGSRFSNQCKVRQCSECQGDTEFYCNTCKQNLCLQCNERHVFDLDTKYHDVGIYREKYENHPKQETCERHPKRVYNKYCHSRKLPVCLKCKEHKNHNVLDIRVAYKTNRQQHKEIIHNIRSETLYNSSCVLAGIKYDTKTCHAEISNHQSKISMKGLKLRDFIDTVMCDVDFKHNGFIQSLQHQRRKINTNLEHHRRKINRYLTSIETFEHRSDQLANRPLEFLMFLKSTRVHKLKDTLSLTQYAMICLIKEINMEDVTDLLNEIQIIETGKRQVRNERQLKLMSTQVLTKSVTVTGDIYHIKSISCVASDRAWINDGKSIILINLEGDILHHVTDIICVFGQHTVNLTGDLIYIDRDGNIIKFSKDYRTKTTLIKKKELWVPECIYSSHLNGDLLVGMWSYKTCIIARYKDTGKLKKKIRHGNTGQELYSVPIYITENCNGDVIVSDYGRAVVVTESGGKHRFSYTKHPSGSRQDHVESVQTLCHTS